MVDRKRLDRSRPAGLSASFRARRKFLLAGLFLCFVVAGASTFYRQFLEMDFLQKEGESRYLRVREIPARRGMILDRNGEPLAVSTPVATLWADPRRLHEFSQGIAPLADALDMDSAKLHAKVDENRERAFIYLKRRVTPQTADAVQRLIDDETIGGVYRETEYRRFFPGVEVFGHVVGFTDINDRGQEGMERAFDSWLRAEPGKRLLIQDGQGHQVEELEQIQSPKPGKNLELSLDRRLQFLTYRELKRAVTEHRAKSGSAVVLDVQTGEVLAMVNQPGYNPNSDLSGSGSNRRNRALTDVMEPGSTLKPFVVAAAVEAGLVGPGTKVDTRPGTLKVGRNRVRDIHNYGILTTTAIITKSSNVGVVKLAQMMDRSVLWGLYDSLGFGRRSGSQFPGESQGVLAHYNEWSRFEHATAAFGYGVSVNTLQLARAYAVLAADGVKRPVSLLKVESPPEGERLLKVDTARKVRAMLETVVSNKGTARRAAVEGYRVAGKTGTAKKAGRGGYTGRRYQSVFAGMAPAGRPRLVMVVMVDEPGGKHYYGGLVAAPVFSKVMAHALRLFNVPPDDPTTSLTLARAEEPR